MKKIKLLDCTLRDGGYVNNWDFGESTVKRIVKELYASGVDIVECGFLTNKVEYVDGVTQFTAISQISSFVKRRDGMANVCMINYGEYKIEDIPEASENKFIDGIRIAFHKKDVAGAIQFCKAINDKGYLVFLQPMITIRYSDMELLELVAAANKIKPYAFYIVDSFGVMKRDDLLRLFYLINNNLDRDVLIGYHSHNNLQLSFSNSQELLNIKTDREIIIDASVFGMGRGAGNLNIELFMDYLNNNYDKNYAINPILRIIDESLASVYKKSFWGYSLPHYLSAVNNCHPNYASFLTKKSTLTVEAMNKILASIIDDKRVNYDKSYIEDMYIRYQDRCINCENSMKELSLVFAGKNVILVAPGNSAYDNIDKINDVAKQEGAICVTVNFTDTGINSQVAFLSNLKRVKRFGERGESDITIITSNINVIDGLVVSYGDLLQDDDLIIDNSSLMLIKLFIKLGVKMIYVAGFDGYKIDNNYIDRDMEFPVEVELLDEKNKSISKQLQEYASQIDIKFITPSLYE